MRLSRKFGVGFSNSFGPSLYFNGKAQYKPQQVSSRENVKVTQRLPGYLMSKVYRGIWSLNFMPPNQLNFPIKKVRFQRNRYKLRNEL